MLLEMKVQSFLDSFSRLYFFLPLSAFLANCSGDNSEFRIQVDGAESERIEPRAKSLRGKRNSQTEALLFQNEALLFELLPLTSTFHISK